MIGYALVTHGAARRILTAATALLLAGATSACTKAAHGSVAPAAASAPAVADIPVSPFEAAISLLRKQGAALLSGDGAGWLAAVDPGQPALQARYRTMFETLRALDVSRLGTLIEGVQPLRDDEELPADFVL